MSKEYDSLDWKSDSEKYVHLLANIFAEQKTSYIIRIHIIITLSCFNVIAHTVDTLKFTLVLW